MKDDIVSMGRLLTIVLSMFISAASIFGAEESLYPFGYNIAVEYITSASRMAIVDTLVITRTVTNDESFDIHDLYFSENLPPEFEVISSSVKIDNVDIENINIGPILNHEIPGFNSFYWIIDSPGSETTVTNSLSPGSSLVLEFQVIFNNVGLYTLPFHSTIFFSSNSGFFTLSDSIEVEVVLSLDSDEDNDTELLPENYLLTTVYPNPFNSSVSIEYSGSRLAGKVMELEIFDILGRKTFEQNIVADDNHGRLTWDSDITIKSGLYFYLLKSGHRKSTGKLLLLK